MNDSFADRTTMGVLGVTRVVGWLEPRSPMGRLQLKRRKAWRGDELAEWEVELERLRASEEWMGRGEEEVRVVRDALEELPEIDRVKLRLQGTAALEDAELFTLKRFLFHGARALAPASELVARWGAASDLCDLAADLMAAVHPENVPSPRFRLAASIEPGLAEARSAAKSARKSWETARSETEEAIVAELGGRFDVRGFYHPDAEADAARIAGHARLKLVDGRWLTTGDRLDAARVELEECREGVEELEDRLRERLTRLVRTQLELLGALERWVGELDLRMSIVELKLRMRGSWPSVGATFRMRGGRDPRMAERLGAELQSIDVRLEKGATVVTGPNMGGKSALLKLVGLSQWLAQKGLPVPCDELEIPFVDRIVYIGSEEPDAQDETEGLSSFGREIRRLVEAHGGDGRTLWLMDELGRGTHPDDGAALAVEIVERLAGEGDDVVAATHFPALAAMAGARHLRIRGLIDEPGLTEAVSIATDDLELRQALQRAMDYRPEEVADDDVPRDARIVAQALGLWRTEGEEES